jgi:hypothetical protein
MTRGLTRLSALPKATTAVAIAALTVGITPGDAKTRDPAPTTMIGTRVAIARGTFPAPLAARARDGNSKASLQLDGARRYGVRSVRATAQAGTNVVPNPGFEQGGCGSTAVLCGWTATDPTTSMSQDTTNPHTGGANMNVECASPACDLLTGGAAYVSTDPTFCAPIGPGAHQASFWYRDAQATEVDLGAAFYATPDCTGSSSSDFFGASPVGGGWQQVTGALAAPPGTQSALFSLDVIGGCIGACEDPQPCYCGIAANFDDIEVADLGDTTPPAISSFTPTSGPEETWVTITGTNFTGATSVAFNGTSTLDFYVFSSTEIVVFVPPGATSGPISVTTPFGIGTSSDSFTATASPPDICCFDPTSAPVGTSVHIMGVDLTGATSVTFNGTADPSFVVNSPTDITAHVPAGATSGPISVTTPGGTATSGGSFTVTLPQPPTISSFTPTSGTVGTSVDIQGSGFTGTTSVKFNGAADASFAVNSSTDITAHVPSGASSGTISVTTPAGTSASATSFRVIPPPPAISSFSPTGGTVGTSVSITGTSFTGASEVTFNGTAASYTVNSPTSIAATVPTGATTGPISVTTPGGTATSTGSFTVIPPLPTITNFSPTSGHAGQQVTITGSNLTSAISLKLGGAPALFTVNSATQITATVPTIPHGFYRWSVTTPSGTGTSTSSFHVK